MRVTVSPMKRLAIVEVRIGCRPGISADMPAGTPWLIADEHAAEIEPVHQRARREAMADLRPAAASARRR